jgi:hypothetical protein
MFHKNYLLKCIKSDDHSIIEQSYDLFNVNDETSNTTKIDTNKLNQLSSISSRLKQKFNTSKYRPAIKKAIKRKVSKNKSSSSSVPSNKTSKSSLSFGNMTNLSFLNATSNLLSSTTMSGILHNNNESNKSNNFYINSLLSNYHDLSWDENSDDDNDSDDSYLSDISSLSTSFDNEKTINYLTLRNEDLNSSISSVSSLEYEPFELSVASIQPNRAKKYSKSRFDPLISSSRSNVLSTTNSNKRKLSCFEPFSTSSRRSLFIQDNGSLNQKNCTHCCDDQDNEDKLYYNSTKSTSSLTSANWNFLFDQNICSSTLCSINMKKLLNDKNNSTTIRQYSNNNINNRSLSNASSSSSLGSVISLS